MTGSSSRPATSAAGYRIRPRIGVAVPVVIAYIVVVFGLQLASGLEYVEWASTAENGVKALLIPLVAGSLLLILFLAVARWDMVWRDPERLPMTRWMKAALWFFVIAIVLRLAATNWSEVGLSLLMVILGAGVLVGFAEETLFRGIFLRSMRTNGRDEARAAIWTAVAFGLFHLPNLLVGVGLFQVGQIVLAALTGGILYLFRRQWAFILPAMIAHGMWDVSSFTVGIQTTTFGTAVVGIALLFGLVVGIGALVSVWRNSQGMVVTPEGVATTTGGTGA